MSQRFTEEFHSIVNLDLEELKNETLPEWQHYYNWQRALAAHLTVKLQWISYANALKKHRFGKTFTLITKLKMSAFSYRIISVIFNYEK